MLQTFNANLSDRYAEEAVQPLVGECRIWDSTTKGFLLRVWPSGRKVFCVRLRSAGKAKIHTIGKFQAPWTTVSARSEASRLLAQEKNRRLGVKAAIGGAMTVACLADLYLAEGPLVVTTKRESSWKNDIANLNHHVRPLLGDRVIRELTRSEVVQALNSVTSGATVKIFKTGKRGVARVRGGAGCAARVRTTLATMFNWAVANDLMDKNPAKGIQTASVKRRERYLTDQEAHHLLKTLAEEVKRRRVNKQHANVIRLLLLTGARKSEILGLRWAEVDLGRARITLPPERTKCGNQNGVRRISLGTTATEILSGIERTSDFVFPASRVGRSGHMTGIQKTWKRIRDLCEISDVRLHDLRHSFASFAIRDGEDLLTISKVLGHATTRMTERYLHLRDEDLKGLADRTGARIMQA